MEQRTMKDDLSRHRRRRRARCFLQRRVELWTGMKEMSGAGVAGVQVEMIAAMAVAQVRSFKECEAMIGLFEKQEFGAGHSSSFLF